MTLAFVAGVLMPMALGRSGKIRRWILWISVALGSAIGVGEFVIKMMNPKQTNIAMIRFNRYIVIGIAIAATLAFLALCAQKLRSKRQVFNAVFFGMFNVWIVLSMVYIVPQVSKFTTEFVYFGEDTISTMALLRLIGFLLAHILCAVVFLAAYRVSGAIRETRYPYYAWGVSLGLALMSIVKAVSAMQRLKLIPLNDLVFQIMIFGDNQGKLMMYALLSIGVIMLLDLIVNSRHVLGHFRTPADRRKEKARLRNHRRWSYTLFSGIALSIFILSYVHYIDTKEVELTPAQAFQVEENKIIIPLTDIDDGALHRFSYKTPNGYDVRFIAVKKPKGNSYGLGLDACEICGIAGYFERGDDVVCKRCDVVMNKATIGFKGGCNPIPFPYVIEDGKIIIEMEDLQREEKRFK